MRLARRAVARTAAAVLLSAFVAFLAVPLVHAFDEIQGPYCAGDHCCCAPDADDLRTCFRSVCRCGTATGEDVLVPLGNGILPARVVVPRVEHTELCLLPEASLPPSPPLRPPFHPPPSA